MTDCSTTLKHISIACFTGFIGDAMLQVLTKFGSFGGKTGWGLTEYFSPAWSCGIHVYCRRYDDVVLRIILGSIWVPCKMVLFSDIWNYTRFNIPQDYDIFQPKRLLPTIKLFLVWFLGSRPHDNAPRYNLLVRLYRQGKEINTKI